MHAVTVIVTRPEYLKAQSFFDALPDLRVVVSGPEEADVAAAVRAHGAQAVVLGVERYSGPLYTALPRGAVLARFGVGHDGIDKGLATAAGLLATNTPGVLEDAVAEHAVALMLGVHRNLARYVADLPSGAWRPVQGHELRGRTLAVIGCGAIGRRLARIAAIGFGMRVVGMDPAPVDAEALRRDWGIAEIVADFAAAVSGADVVSLHLPANASTRHLIRAETLALLSPRTVLINTARGAVVDENALYDALASGRLGAAGLDVFEVEPYVPRDPARDLRALPNVLLTPHVSSSTIEACARVAVAAVENIRHALAGRYRAMNLLNPEVVPL